MSEVFLDFLLLKPQPYAFIPLEYGFIWSFVIPLICSISVGSSLLAFEGPSLSPGAFAPGNKTSV